MILVVVNFYLLNPIKLHSRIIYVFSTIQMLILNLKSTHKNYIINKYLTLQITKLHYQQVIINKYLSTL